jgi:hypothetical protein
MHSTDDLEDGYVGSGTRLWHSIKKHGRENFKLEILEFCSDRESLKKREAELITEEMLNDPMCMNLSFGGGEIRLTHEQYVARNKICNQKLQEKMKSDPEFHAKFRQRIRETTPKHTLFKGGKTKGTTGMKFSDDWKKKLSDQKSGEKNNRFGTCWIYSESEKRSISIKIDRLEEFLANGWLRGRKMKF